jgi:hypothetical protein
MSTSTVVVPHQRITLQTRMRSVRVRIVGISRESEGDMASVGYHAMISVFKR